MASRKRDDDADDCRPDVVDARIEELKRTAAALNDGQMKAHVSPDCPPHIQEQFWRRIIAAESAIEEQPFDVLTRSGLTLPSPEELDDSHITAELWKVVRGLALIGMYLEFTDHLSDRELYARLWTDILRVPTALQSDDGAVAWHVDLTASGSDDGIETYLKYYADEDDRRRWADEWPDDPLPEAERLPFDRDRHLPQPFFTQTSPPLES